MTSKRLNSNHPITISIETYYLPEYSLPSKQRFYFLYRVNIKNQSERLIKISSRFFRIVNAQGKEQIVDAPGVIGKTPIIEPHEHFEYTSFVPLKTTSGRMEGFYRLIDEKQNRFKVKIGQIRLSQETSKTIEEIMALTSLR